MIKDKTLLNININKDDSNINDYLFCWDKFKSRPNKVAIHSTYSSKLFLLVIDDLKVSKNIFTEIIPDSEEFIINDKVLIEIDDDIYISYVVIDRNLDTSIISDVVFYYKSEDSLSDLNKIIDKLNECLVDFCEEESFNLNTVNLSSNGLEIEPIDYQNSESDLDLFYSEKTYKNINKLIKKIKKSEKGLSVLWGERGTGKTSIINYLADKLDRIVIFIPNNLIEHTINNPDFRKFLKKYHKPVLVLDDCEMIFNEYFTKSNMVVNNLMQLVDGFLSDNIKVNIITILNVDDESEIDHSLLDTNNIIDIVEFEYLTKDESNELAKHINQKVNYKEKNRLIDVLNKRVDTNQKKMGF